MSHFIAERIQVVFDQSPAVEKKPGCPDAFEWRGQTFRVAETLAEWHDYARRGRMAANMQPQHAAVAATRGSWGVGRSYFRVRTEGGRVFELYYDRAPSQGSAGDASGRKGAWFLYREITASSQ